MWKTSTFFINCKSATDCHLYFNALTVINEDKTYIVQRKPITVRRAWFTFNATINFCFLLNIHLLKLVYYLETQIRNSGKIGGFLRGLMEWFLLTAVFN